MEDLKAIIILFSLVSALSGAVMICVRLAEHCTNKSVLTNHWRPTKWCRSGKKVLLFAAKVCEQRTAPAVGLQDKHCSDPSTGAESRADGDAFALGLKYHPLDAQCLKRLG